MRLEPLLASVQHYGSWVASMVIGLGLAMAMVNLATLPAMRMVTAGIALFILLPVLRVALMLGVFLRRRDYRFSAIAALVLTIIFLGFALGTYMPPAER